MEETAERLGELMARRKKACEFCEDDVFSDYQEHRNGFMMYWEWYPFNGGLLAVIAQANDEGGEFMEDSVDFNFNYCPMCGRKLRDPGPDD